MPCVVGGVCGADDQLHLSAPPAKSEPRPRVLLLDARAKVNNLRLEAEKCAQEANPAEQVLS